MAIHARSRRVLVLALVAPAACGDRVYALGAAVDGGAGSSSSGAVQDEGTTDEPDSRPPMPPMDDDESGDDAPAEGPGFIMDPDGGSVSWECDLWAQDCPAGEKCNVWANDGGNLWNASKCVPIDPDPDDIGEVCTVVDNGVSGVDSCVLGAMCFYVDPDTNMGECIAFCQGSQANPLCEDPSTHCEGREFSICVPSCCPLEQACHEGEACYPVGHTFSCVPDASGERGGFREPCEFVNACDPGLFCGNAEAIPDCEGSQGCCTSYCEVGADHCADYDPALECVPWFEEGEAPPGEELVGGCLVPV